MPIQYTCVYSQGRETADSMLVKRGMPDASSRVAVYPMPVPSSSSNCSHDKGHLYASFGAHSPAEGHKRLAQCSVGGLNLVERGEHGEGERGRTATTEFSIWRQNRICICICLCFGPAQPCRLPHNEMQFKCLRHKLLSQLSTPWPRAGRGGGGTMAERG